MCPLHDQPFDLAGVHLDHHETANIPLSNGSNSICENMVLQNPTIIYTRPVYQQCRRKAVLLSQGS